ncbi:MAG: cadherin-like beta sandwich domain-containing protein [Candidatus Thiodiazotropha sp. (ex Lucinoma annulata)]|nr:cadherin-like beta sandwich domain-containing protein [Candidatus Thiodiazotropha sp. (ex Lucinoma annulata)]
MDTLLIRKWIWTIFQTVFVMVLLSGCGGGGDADTGGSSDASLSELTIDGIALDKAVQADQLNYSVSVDFSQDSITLTPVVADSGATIRISDSEVTSGTVSAPIVLDVGENRIDIVVTAGNRSTTVTYTLTVSRASASSGASLSDLGLTGAMLDQLFQPSQTTYSASAGFLQASVTLTPVTTDIGATIHVNNSEVTSGNATVPIVLSEGQNTISLVVTAEDGVTTQHYSIEILRDDATSFAQQAFLKASNADGGYSQRHGYYGDQFGSSVAISGDTLVVGAPGRSIRLIGIEWNDSRINFGAV